MPGSRDTPEGGHASAAVLLTEMAGVQMTHLLQTQGAAEPGP